MNKGEQLAEHIISQKNWRGGVNLTENGVRQLIKFCYNKGSSDKSNEQPAIKPDDFASIFADVFKNAKK